MNIQKEKKLQKCSTQCRIHDQRLVNYFNQRNLHTLYYLVIFELTNLALSNVHFSSSAEVEHYVLTMLATLKCALRSQSHFKADVLLLKEWTLFDSFLKHLVPRKVFGIPQTYTSAAWDNGDSVSKSSQGRQSNPWQYLQVLRCLPRPQ